MRPTVVLLLAICCSAVVAAQRSTNSVQPWSRQHTSRRSKVKPTVKVATRFGAPIVQVQNVQTRNDEQLSRAVADLAFSIGRNAAGQNSGSEVFSPVSIMGVLNMLLLGADGITRAELLGALKLGNKLDIRAYHRRAGGMLNNLLAGIAKELDQLAWKGQSCVSSDYEDEEEAEPPKPKSPKELRIANAIFAQHNLPIGSQYVGVANALYGASTQKINFRDSRTAASTINKWVTQATNGKIREVSSGQFSSDTNMVIASSLYFKATWETEFLARATRPKIFFPNGIGGPSVKVDMMTLTDCMPYHFEKSMGLRIIGFPYSDNATTMYVMMPQNSTRAKLRSLQKQLTASQIDSLIPKMKRRTATVIFPRMQLTSSTNLEKALRQLGVKSIFSAQQSNLNLMLEPTARNNSAKLFVSQINHKVVLSVDERGTEGAAVTVTLIDRAGPEVIFNANVPFLIYVRHDPTRLPIFYGAVFDPRG